MHREKSWTQDSQRSYLLSLSHWAGLFQGHATLQGHPTSALLPRFSLPSKGRQEKNQFNTKIHKDLGPS